MTNRNELRHAVGVVAARTLRYFSTNGEGFNVFRTRGMAVWWLRHIYNSFNWWQAYVVNAEGERKEMPMLYIGERCSIFAQQLFQSDEYTDYLFFHGLTVQLSEALAEWSHARIRRECGFGAEEPQAINDLLAQRYRGCRFSFGYPACPNVGDSRQQLKWLNSDSIGLIMDSNDQLQPEQSTTALIALHSQAHYFST